MSRDRNSDAFSGSYNSEGLYGSTNLGGAIVYMLNSPVVIFKTLVPEKLRNGVINTFSENNNDTGYYGSTHICSAIGHVLSAPARALKAFKHE